MNNYNFVLFSSNEEYSRVSFGNILSKDNVYYQSEFICGNNKFLRKMFLLHYYSPIAKIFKLPQKRVWFSKIFVNPFRSTRPIIFIFFHRWKKIIDEGYIDYLREKFPGCKCVLYLQDLDNARKMDLYLEKKRFDHVMVFEKNIAKQYEIEYYPLVYDDYQSKEKISDRTTDLLFVGGAKNRYEILKGIFDKLTDQGVRCRFYISGMERPDGCNDMNIQFSKKISYADSIKFIKEAKCILDIIPAGTNCSTLRMSEAIAYGNRIITNNEHVMDEPYFQPEYISVYHDPSDIDIEFLKKPFNGVDYINKDEISPQRLLTHLESLFTN